MGVHALSCICDMVQQLPGGVSQPNFLPRSICMYTYLRNHVYILLLLLLLLQVLDYVDDNMPPETPLAFGLHPNAEIGFKLREAETFCNSLVQLQPRESGGKHLGLATGITCAWCVHLYCGSARALNAAAQ